MHRIIAILSVIITLLSPFIQAQNNNNPDEQWYPFYFPEKLDPDSPMNMGKLVLDAPAGKHGFCKVKDGHFYFEDGTRAKFWGTNLCFSACFPTHKQAEMLAERIAFFGFNAVRLHHMDMHFAPLGIFEDIDPAYTNPQKKHTGTLSKEQLDRLDYLIYQLKTRGIYINMNLLVSRFFTEADGVIFAQELGMAAKPISMFDPVLISLQKKYAKDLLTHLNPYTKLRYCDDPTIALVEMTNENSIVASWQHNNLNGRMFGLNNKGVPDYYSQQLDTLWNTWLKNKYSTPELVKHAWYSNMFAATVSDNNLLPDLSAWQVEQHQGTKTSVRQDKNLAQLTVTVVTDAPWHVQYRCVNIPLAKNKNYILSFTARATGNTQIGVVSQQAFSPWVNLGLSESINLTTDFQDYSIPFTASADCPNAKVGLIIGYTPSTIEIKHISLRETSKFPPEQTDVKSFQFPRPIYKLRNFYPEKEIIDALSFYSDLEKSYFTNMLDWLRKEIGLRVPATGIGGYSSDDSLPGLQTCDFIDKHAYWDHPRFPGKPWDKNNFTIHNKSILQDPGFGIIGPLTTAAKKAAALGKPFTVTEWNHCYPNQYAYETPLLLASAAQKNDWDALFQFAFSHGWQKEPTVNDIQSFFDIMSNSQQLVLCSIGSRIFLTNTQVSYNFSNDQVIIRLSGSQEHRIGGIKNSNSKWMKNHFIWGNAPVLIKNKSPSSY